MLATSRMRGEDDRRPSNVLISSTIGHTVPTALKSTYSMYVKVLRHLKILEWIFTFHLWQFDSASKVYELSTLSSWRFGNKQIYSIPISTLLLFLQTKPSVSDEAWSTEQYRRTFHNSFQESPSLFDQAASPRYLWKFQVLKKWQEVRVRPSLLTP